jgi:hypothetical protein
VEVTKLWKCGNCGNIFGLGNCGRPWVVYKCVCGVDIGGTRHVPTKYTKELTPAEQKKYQQRGDKYNIHEYLRDSYKSFLDLHPLCFRFLHSFIHGLYLGWIETGYVEKSSLFTSLLPGFDNDFGHLKITNKRDYFKRHIKVDFEVVQQMRNKNYLEYNLMTSIVLKLFKPIMRFIKCQESFASYNSIAKQIGQTFLGLIRGGNSLSIETKIDKFIKETSLGIKNEEKEIILRNLTINEITDSKLNEFLFYHLRNTNIPSISNMIEYMRNNPGLNDKFSFITFYNEYSKMMDDLFKNTFTKMREICNFMNNNLQNEFKKKEMEEQKVVDFIKSIGKLLDY